MAKPTITVTTQHGTFTRTTARTYTHIVIVQGLSASYRANLERQVANNDPWSAHAAREIEKMQSAPFGPIGWCGSLALARKAANGRIAKLFANVVIIDVATGAEVR